MNEYEQQILINQMAIMSALACLMVNNTNYLTKPAADQMDACVEDTGKLFSNGS